jgi:two-component system KDP operon response regulator KdpE
MTPTNTQPTLLVIDDEEQIRNLLRVTLKSQGFVVRDAETGGSGLRDAVDTPPGGVILDLGLPDMDGLDVLRRLREWSQTPVLVLTVRDSEDDKIAALDAGADDYLTKPFSGRELLARLRAIMRRRPTGDDAAVVSFGEVEMDMSSRLVHRAGKEVHLTAREYGLLRVLALSRGKVVTHQTLLRELWGPNAEDNTHYLRVFMTHLRQKLEPDPHSPRYLKTEAGVGYRLIEDEA